MPERTPWWATFLERWKLWLPLVVVILAGFGVKLVVLDDNGDNIPDRVTIERSVVNRAPDDGAPATTITVPKPAVDAAREALEGELRTTPEQTPDAQVQQAQERAAEIKTEQAPLPTAGATQGIEGCVTRFVVNQSSRNGVHPVVQVLHYTVSPNRVGLVDMNAVATLFNTRSFQASSNFLIDGEGHCYYLVPIENKAWTQAGGNPFAISYEIINSGSESVYLAPAGLAKLRSVMRQVARRTGIPLRAGRISGCTPVLSGIVDHRQGGICWGGHGDIGPFKLAPIIAYVARAPTALLADEQRVVAGVKARGVTGGHSHAYWCGRAQARRLAIRDHARASRGGWNRRHRDERFQAISTARKRGCR